MFWHWSLMTEWIKGISLITHKSYLQSCLMLLITTVSFTFCTTSKNLKIIWKYDKKFKKHYAIFLKGCFFPLNKITSWRLPQKKSYGRSHMVSYVTPKDVPCHLRPLDVEIWLPEDVPTYGSKDVPVMSFM